MKKIFTAALLGVLLASAGLRAEAGEDGIVRILAIGNSFSQDAVENYLHELADSAGFTTIIANMYIGGSSLETHYDNAVGDLGAYSYNKIDTSGNKTTTSGVKLSTALADEQWDYVSLQQVSSLSGLYDTYSPYLSYLVDYVKSYVSGVKLVWHQTWAYAQTSTHSGFANYGNDQQQMYQAIVSAARNAYNEYSFDVLVPTGTAVQNARTTFIGDNMNRDGYHLNVEYGRYTAACTWLEAVLGASAVDNGYAPSGVDGSLKTAAQESAHAACLTPDTVTDLSYIKMDSSGSDFYVKADGDGDGSSWDSAMSFSAFEAYAPSISYGDVFYFAGGTYTPSATIEINVPCTIIGGFDPNATGSDTTEPDYPSSTPTIFSGDLNGSGGANVGDLAEIVIVSITSDLYKSEAMTLRGVEFTSAYNSDTGSDAELGALHVIDCQNLVVESCRFYQNASAGYGGVAFRSEYSTSHFTDCEFTDNTAGSRGAAIRLSSNSSSKGYMTLERCLVAANSTTAATGSAICVQHGQRLTIINSTIQGNTGASGGAIYSNGANSTFDNQLVVISSTIAGNTGGNQIQIAQGANVRIINSIVCGTSAGETSSDAAIAVTGSTESSLFSVVSAGSSILGAYVNAVSGAQYTPQWDDSDNISADNTVSSVFASGELDNGTLIPLETVAAGASPDAIASALESWEVEDVDATVDQLGVTRTSTSYPGAYGGGAVGVAQTMADDRAGTQLWYNLQGVCLGSTPQKGLCISRGRKIFVR